MNFQTHAIRERRTPLSGRLGYRYEPDLSGSAAWLDVSRTGAGLRLGRYLRPGRRLRLYFDAPLPWGPAQRIEMEGRVVWCRQAPNGPEFEAGLEMRRENPDAALAFAALGYEAQAESNKSEVREVEPIVWHCLRVSETDHPQPAAAAAVPQAV